MRTAAPSIDQGGGQLGGQLGGRLGGPARRADGRSGPLVVGMAVRQGGLSGRVADGMPSAGRPWKA
jgi:hypothetical protein